MAAVNGLLGRKRGMTRVFGEGGKAVPVTVMEAGPCVVVQKKNLEKDGYRAVQLGFEALPSRKAKKLSKPLQGHFSTVKVSPQRSLAEFRCEGEDLELGAEIKIDLFKPGDRVKVIGVSKGKGFAGGIKRWHFSGQGASHGAKIHRKPASAGATDPAHVFKGKHSPGRMGNCRVTVKGLTVVETIPERNLLLVQGSVPGANGSLLRIEKM